MSDTPTQQPVNEPPVVEETKPQKGGLKSKLFHEFRETAMTIAIFVPFWLVFSTFVYELRSIPSESMVPALQVGDRVAVAKFAYGYNRNSIPFGIGTLFIGDNKDNPNESVFASTPKRGDVIVFQHPHSDRVMIKRLIGLPGDRVEVKGGKLFLNGSEVPREKVRTTSYVPDDSNRLMTATEYRQTIPTGEGDHTKSFLIHEFSDNGDLDETPVFTVPAGHVFMMGDNRDNSEDSRAPSGHRSMAAAFPQAWPYRSTSLPTDTRDDAIGFVPFDYLIGRAETVLFTLHGCKQAPGAECPEGRLWKGL
ncbi:MAG TPA: signal peptidase I [Hyphomonadaceae bacterium]|nr:signal peptidase I [Hyphomonadaceae bacterium]